jgi:hypothetical protein
MAKTNEYATDTVDPDKLVTGLSAPSAGAVKNYRQGALAELARTGTAPNDQTGTTYTAVLADALRVVRMNNSSANTVTIPPNSAVAFPVGTVLEVWQQGAGQTTIVAGSGVTIRVAATFTLKLAEQYAGCSLRKMAADTWYLIGNLEAV